VRIVGFQRAAVEAYALPPAERAAAFARLDRLEGLRSEAGERIRRLEVDLVRAATYAAIAALAETVVVPTEVQRFTVSSSGIEPVAAHDLRTELIAPEPSLTVPPAVECDANGEAIVIWCGGESVRTAALIVYALAGSGFPVVVVADGTIPGAERDATFVRLADGVEALRRARLVIPANPADPADAIAFARLGFRIAAPSSSGAWEYLPGAGLFRTWVARDVLLAVQRAIATPPPLPGALPTALPDLAPLATSGPRVVGRIAVDIGSPIAPETTQTLAAQTYASVVRTLENAAFELTVPSGAVMFPDALARLVEAAQRSQAIRVLAPLLRGRAGGVYAIDGDALCLRRLGGGRVPLARVSVACGVMAA
jgi:hypothetical protein